MSRIDPPGGCPVAPPAVPPPSMEFSRSLSGLLVPLAPPLKIDPSGSWPPLIGSDPRSVWTGRRARWVPSIGSSFLIRSPVLTTTEAAAESLGHLILIGAEDVADDFLTVVGIHLIEIDTAIDQLAGVLAERSGQRPGAGGIFGIGLHSAKQRGDCLTRHLFGGGLVNSQLRGKLVHRNVGQDVIYSTHY